MYVSESVLRFSSTQRQSSLHMTQKPKERKKGILFYVPRKQNEKREYRRMFSRLSLFGHVWSVEGVSIYTCQCAGCRQIQDVRFSLLSPCHVSDFLRRKVKRNTSRKKCLRLSNGYAWDCLQFLTRHGCPHRSGHMVPHGDLPAGELKRENRFRMIFKDSRTIWIECPHSNRSSTHARAFARALSCVRVSWALEKCWLEACSKSSTGIVLSCSAE